MSEKKNDDNTSLYAIAILGSSVLAMWYWEKHKYQFFAWYFDHRLFIAAVIAFLIVMSGYLVFTRLFSKYQAYTDDRSITNGNGKDSCFMGYDDRHREIFLIIEQLLTHLEVFGTTKAGKSESVVAPLSVFSINRGSGMILIDGKAESRFVNKLYAYAVKAGRAKDFRLFSLSNTGASHSYNPLVGGKTDQIAEKVFKSFGFQNEHYANAQLEVFKNALYIFEEACEIPTFLKLWQAISDPAKLHALSLKGESPILKEWAKQFLNEDKNTRYERVSGLLTKLNEFSTGDTAVLFNTHLPSLDVNQAMEEGLIVYFQLPVLKYANLGRTVAKIVLGDIQSAVSNRHENCDKAHKFFPVFLDDFSEYMTKDFVSLLNKSRSANVGIIFAHQSVGDLDCLGVEVKNQISTNANLKIFMRTTEPDSAEYFAKTIGTKTGKKVTERQRKSILGTHETGDGSARETEEFIFHPNLFKTGLGVGEAVMLIPHDRGSKAVKIKFQRCPDLPRQVLPTVAKLKPEYLNIEIKEPEASTTNGNKLAQAAAEGSKNHQPVGGAV
jgi:type IV secretory pathway TraG/TraD family ATPase VirD4